jgi:hypothetical protein
MLINIMKKLRELVKNSKKKIWAKAHLPHKKA